MSQSRRDVNPFPGLRPFETDEYMLFFGREGQSDELLARLSRTRFLAVVGTSGSGKSSLIRAGLLPAMRGGLMKGAGAGWRISVMRPGHDPVGNLAQALAAEGVLAEAGGGLQGAEGEALIEATLRTGSLGLVNAARQARLAEHENLLVVVDQFEELFRFRAARAGTADEAAAFVKLLLEAARQREHNVYVVITMRSDFLGDCAQFQGLPEAINDGQYLIPRMTRDERRMAITGPVAVARGRISEPLVSRLLNDVGDNPDQLPILQHALMRTWDYWKQHRREAREPIDIAHYEAIGTMSDALSRHADEAWDELADERSREIAERMFRALTERGADNRETRRPTRLRELAEIAGASESEVVAVIEVFRRAGRSFLMPPVGVPLTGEVIVDISHESLIRNWGRLKEWVADEAQSARTYRRLAEAAVLHREGREGLLQDPALEIALDWRERSRPNAAWARHYHPEFELAVEYLEASRAARDEARAERERQRREEFERERREREQAERFAAQQARSARRMRRLTFAMILLALLSAGTAAYAFNKRATLARARDELKQALDVSEQRKRDAETAQGRAEQSFKDLQQTQVQLEAQKLAAEANAERATEANERAQAALKHARTEAARANRQAAIAAAKRREAEDAKQQALDKQKEVEAAQERSELIRKGLEAYLHGEFHEAADTFRELDKKLSALGPDASAPKGTDARRYAVELGWTHSRIGAALQNANPYDQNAVEPYERALAIFDKTHPPDSNDLVLLETYEGLARSYQTAAKLKQELQGRRMAAAQNPGLEARQAGEQAKLVEEAFSNAETFFVKALNFQQRHRQHKPSEVANGYLNLARLYVDRGHFPKAEEHFEAAIKLLREEPAGNTLTRLTRARRELAELYELKLGRYDDAVRVFHEMIAQQEEQSHSIDEGQEVANSYSDLAQLYSAKGDLRKAQSALAVANLTQRLVFKARRLSRMMEQGGEVSEVVEPLKEYAADLDALGDAHVRLGTLDHAERYYLAALENREELDEAVAKRQGSSRVSASNRFVSYHKLSNFYLQDKPNQQKAEEFKKLLTEAYTADPQLAIEYAKAQTQLGDAYEKDRSKAREAAEAYERALAVYGGQTRWWDEENRILFKLDKLHHRQGNQAERERAIRRRLETMTRIFKQVSAPDKDKTKVSRTVVLEYLNAAERAGIVYGRNGKPKEAQDAFRRALEDYDFITSLNHLKATDNLLILDAYASVLDRYTDLLGVLNQRPAAAGVAEKAAAVRKKRRDLEISLLERDEQAQQDSPPAAPAAQ